MGTTRPPNNVVANSIPKITALEAEAAASLFLSDRLPDRLTAGDPRLDGIEAPIP